MVDSIFGASAQALELCENRSVLLTDNLANSSTPNYKARDIDFYGVLQQQQQTGNTLTLSTDSPTDLSPSLASDPEVKYRVPMQTSQDGNTVDEEIERKDFMENAMHYQVNLAFIRNKSDELMQAIKGE